MVVKSLPRGAIKLQPGAQLLRCLGGWGTSPPGTGPLRRKESCIWNQGIKKLERFTRTRSNWVLLALLRSLDSCSTGTRELRQVLTSERDQDRLVLSYGLFTLMEADWGGEKEARRTRLGGQGAVDGGEALGGAPGLCPGGRVDGGVPSEMKPRRGKDQVWVKDTQISFKVSP